jgi:ribosome-associated protein
MNQYPTTIKTLLSILDNTHATNTVVLDVKNLTAVTDYMIITTGRSSRNVKAIAETILEQPKDIFPKAIGVSGMELGEWVLLDFGDFIVNIMQEQTREHYQLEELWQN